MAHQRLIRMERCELVACRFCKQRTQHEVYTNRMHCTRCGKTTHFGPEIREARTAEGISGQPGNDVV